MQLVGAIAAADAVQPRTDPGRVAEHVIIHDLCAPAGQHVEFARGLEQLAQWLRPGVPVTYLSPEVLRVLDKTGKRRGRRAAADELQNTLGVGEVASLFLGQAPLPLCDFLAELFPSSRKYCYGDSIGVNFSPRYFAPPPAAGLRSRLREWRSFWRETLVSWLRRTPGGVNAHRSWGFDQHCLLLPNRFDQIVPHVRQLSLDDFRRPLEHCAAWLASQPATKAAGLTEALENCSAATILLTSNFSEANRMLEKDELAAYRELVGRPRRPGRQCLIVKPHPRDSAAKLARLRSEFAADFEEIVFLDDPYSFYVPFEAIFLNTFSPRPDWLHKTRFVCVSSACLSLELLYGVPCTSGFGPGIVQRRFRPQWVGTRLGHERDLQRIVTEIRTNRTLAA